MNTHSPSFPLSASLFARIAAALIVCIGIVARIGNLNSVQTRTPDERVYTRQALAWIQEGNNGIRALAAKYEADPGERFYPQPSRVIMIRMVAATMQLTGEHSERSVVALSCAASIMSLLLVALLGLRYFPPLAAIAGLIFYAVLPPELAIARRAWSDALVELIALAMICLTCEITRGSRRKGLYLSIAVLGAIGIGVKELTALTFAMCFVWIVAVPASSRRDWRNEALLTISCIATVALSVTWMAVAVGGFQEFLHLFTGAATSNNNNSYAVEYNSGPPWYMARTLWIASPLTFVAGLMGIALGFLRGNRVHRWLACFTVAYFGTTLLVPHMINLRYLASLYGPLCLFAGLALDEMILFARNWRTGSEKLLAITAVTILVAAGAIGDYARFQRFFVRDSIGDLSIKMLMDEQRR